MTKESNAPVEIGEMLAGKYRVERILGAGGMGVVVEAMHVELERRVALKFMLPVAAANEAAVERFAREARASAKLRSDNIVHVTDVGTLDSGAPYMVMEFLEGEDLGKILMAQGPLPVDDAIDYVLQACAGLAEAHAAGIIHRDLKPANLVLARREDTVSVVKIVDFGISKVNVPGVANKLTSTRDLMGSPLYMSPEQLASARDVDARTDIWSLGIILYELLSGVLPFDGDTLPQICTAVLVAPAPLILDKRPELPEGLSAIIAKCLGKKPADRYASVGELAAALAEFAPPHSSATLERISRLGPGGATADAAPLSSVVAAPPSAQPHGETASPWTPADGKVPVLAPRSGKRTWVVVAALSALAGLGGAFALMPRGSVSRDSAAVSQPAAQPIPAAAAVAVAAVAAPSASATASTSATAKAPPASPQSLPPRATVTTAAPAWTARPAASVVPSATASAAPSASVEDSPYAPAAATPSAAPTAASSTAPSLAPSSAPSIAPPPSATTPSLLPPPAAPPTPSPSPPHS